VDDIRLSTALPHHPKCLKLERKLGSAGCWAFVKLLLWVSENRPNGSLDGLSDEDIELGIGWAGPESLIAALCDVGFLDGDPQNRAVHEWQLHQPFVATRHLRIQRAREAVSARWSRATPDVRAEVGRQLREARRDKHADESTTYAVRTDGTLPTYSERTGRTSAMYSPLHSTPPKSKHPAKPKAKPSERPSAAPPAAAVDANSNGKRRSKSKHTPLCQWCGAPEILCGGHEAKAVRL
jgi:hypothetical protein